MVYEGPLVGQDERVGHLLHEEGSGMRRGAQNLHATTRQIEDEERGEEVGTGDGASVGLEQVVPGGGPLGDGG